MTNAECLKITRVLKSFLEISTEIDSMNKFSKNMLCLNEVQIDILKVDIIFAFALLEVKYIYINAHDLHTIQLSPPKVNPS